MIYVEWLFDAITTYFLRETGPYRIAQRPAHPVPLPGESESGHEVLRRVRWRLQVVEQENADLRLQLRNFQVRALAPPPSLEFPPKTTVRRAWQLYCCGCESFGPLRSAVLDRSLKLAPPLMASCFRLVMCSITDTLAEMGEWIPDATPEQAEHMLTNPDLPALLLGPAHNLRAGLPEATLVTVRNPVLHHLSVSGAIASGADATVAAGSSDAAQTPRKRAANRQPEGPSRSHKTARHDAVSES